MWARINTVAGDAHNDVVELVTVNPDGRYHPDLIFHEVPEWLQPYIDQSYWWDEATQSFEHMLGYQYPLNKAKARTKAEHFDKAFAEIEDKRARSVATVTEFQALGLPLADYAADLNILGQLNMVAEENRVLLAGLEALSLSETATAEEAQTVLAQARDMRPWLPWREKSSMIGG